MDEQLRVHPAADAFLQHLRLGAGRAEGTTQAYATAVALYLVWCGQAQDDWREAVDRLGGFMLWLRHAPGPSTLRRMDGEPVALVVRQPRRINAVLVAVREFFKHAVAVGLAPSSVLAGLYEVGDDRWLPAELRAEGMGLRHIARPRHRLSVGERQVVRASDEEALALLHACRSARDRLIVLLLARAGLRRGEVAGLRRADVHLALDSTGAGCQVPGEHVHVVRREESPRGAWAKSGRSRAVPVDFLLVQAFDAYAWERQACQQAEGCDFVLVNLFRAPLGVPMRPGALNEVLAALSRRAGLDRQIHPHQLRHAFADNVLAAGGTVDEVQALLGHASPASTQPYLNPSTERLRTAVERVARTQAVR
ncbi:tyrosine-type recombinase/integrase [Nonomuraea recticatena]|uniref:tyrosine-type recombinase/integrase n=1 Tax=Nonomuraea recticatena TaxID=46178 RepID=UPI0031F841C7